MQTLNGKELSERILIKSSEAIINGGLQPRLDIIFVGEDAGSEIYVRKKQEAGTRVGVKVEIHRFIENSDAQVKELVAELSKNNAVHGIILQLPAPGIDLKNVFKMIPPLKDVDGLNPETLGQLWHGNECLIPATAQAVIEALDFIASSEQQALKEWLFGKNVLIINRSLIIGKPLAALLTNLNATVTIAHSKTKDIENYLKRSEIVISGAGVAGLISAEKLMQNSIVIDASFIKTEKGVCGDVGENDLSNVAAWVSPVPNGIGPLGVACLIANTVKAAEAAQTSEAEKA